MTTFTAIEARSKLYKLIEQTANSLEPILIKGKSSNVILISEENWKAVNETLYVVSIPGMRESIIEGMQFDLDDCDKELDW